MEDNKPSAERPPQQPQQPPRPRMRPSGFWLMMALLALSAFMFFSRPGANRSEISYDFFWNQLKDDNIAAVEFDGQTILNGRFQKNAQCFGRAGRGGAGQCNIDSIDQAVAPEFHAQSSAG